MNCTGSIIFMVPGNVPEPREPARSRSCPNFPDPVSPGAAFLGLVLAVLGVGLTHTRWDRRDSQRSPQYAHSLSRCKLRLRLPPSATRIANCDKGRVHRLYLLVHVGSCAF